MTVFYQIGFWLLALVSVGASLLMITTRNPVRSALFLVVTFICVAIYYISLSAQFIAAVQIIVYAGAIMVLFLFVIMLLNLGAPQEMEEKGSIQPMVAAGLAFLFVAVLTVSESVIRLPAARADAAVYMPMGTVEGIGISLYAPDQPWLFPFEITSILLLVAIVGAIIMAKRRPA